VAAAAEHLRRAIEAEVAWHVAGLDILGVAWDRERDVWRRVSQSSPVFLAAISLDHDVTAARLAASVADVEGDVAVLDSFAKLDLTSLGYRKLWTEPWMHRAPAPFGVLGAAPPQLVVARAITPAEIALFEQTEFVGMTDAFDASQRGTVHPASTGLVDTLHPLLGTVSGEAVTVGFSVPFTDGVLVAGIATPAPFRRRGYGAAITRAVCETQRHDDAYLRASDMGLRMYERLGFVTLGMATVWARGPLH
jgi:GNAT superfamily N-acetyltransferase